MKEKNFQKYPKWLKDNKYVERAMEKYVYPIKVEWTGTVPQYHQRHDCFTLDGLYTVATPDPEFDIVPLEAIKVSERGVRIREGEQE